jgi:metal-responsive CopG/Arc/MetJ family transcriptional regulator
MIFLMRNKIPDQEKRKKITATIDSQINDMLDEWMKKNGYDNKSKAVENIILQHMKKLT